MGLTAILMQKHGYVIRATEPYIIANKFYYYKKVWVGGFDRSVEGDEVL
jgi:hypothetical protein